MSERVVEWISLRHAWGVVQQAYVEVTWSDGTEDHFEFDHGLTREEVDAKIAEMFPGVSPCVLC